jgi:hypothetical protein
LLHFAKTEKKFLLFRLLSVCVNNHFLWNFETDDIFPFFAINHHLSFSTCAARRKFAQKLKTRKLQNLQNSTKERKIEFKCFAFKYMSSKRSKFSFLLLSKKLQQFVKFKNQSSDNKTSNNKSIDARQ